MLVQLRLVHLPPTFKRALPAGWSSSATWRQSSILISSVGDSGMRRISLNQLDHSKAKQEAADRFRRFIHLFRNLHADSQLSKFSPSILAMASMAVAIDGLSMTEKTPCRLNEIVAKIHEATHKVNELKQMIDVSFQIEKYVQKLLSSTHDD